jgi:hypothetical protein
MFQTQPENVGSICSMLINLACRPRDTEAMVQRLRTHHEEGHAQHAPKRIHPDHLRRRYRDDSATCWIQRPGSRPHRAGAPGDGSGIFRNCVNGWVDGQWSKNSSYQLAIGFGYVLDEPLCPSVLPESRSNPLGIIRQTMPSRSNIMVN